MSELPDFLPGIDIAAGLPRVAGNKKLYLKLLLQVSGEGPKVQEKLNAAIMAGDANTVREVAHSLKGSAGNLAITDVARAAEQLELAAKAEDFSTLFVHVDALEQAMRRLAEALEGLTP